MIHKNSRPVARNCASCQAGPEQSQGQGREGQELADRLREEIAAKRQGGWGAKGATPRERLYMKIHSYKKNRYLPKQEVEPEEVPTLKPTWTALGLSLEHVERCIRASGIEPAPRKGRGMTLRVAI